MKQLPVFCLLMMISCGSAKGDSGMGVVDPSRPPEVAAAPAQSTEPVTPVPAAPESAVPSATAAPTMSASASAAPTAEPAAAPPADAPPGTNLTVSSMNADGLEVSDLSCAIQDGGLLASVLIVGTLASKKTALKACAAGGDKPRITWTYAGGRVTDVKVKAKTKAIETCVASAIKTIKAPIKGRCAATIVLDK